MPNGHKSGRATCPVCAGTMHQCETGDPGCLHCDDPRCTGELPPGHPALPARHQPDLPALRQAALPVNDRQLFRTINSDGDVLGGLTFDQAVISDPLRIEALIHQRIHNGFYRALGEYPGGGLNEETYILRNNALRQVHGRITAPNLVDSLESNWRDYSQLMDMMAMMVGRGDPQAIEYFNRLMEHRDEILRAFREAGEIARRAARGAVREPDQLAWLQASAVIRDMGEFVDSRLLMPVRRGAAGFIGEYPPAAARPARSAGQLGRRRAMIEERARQEQAQTWGRNVYLWDDGYAVARDIQVERTKGRIAFRYYAGPDVIASMFFLKRGDGGVGPLMDVCMTTDAPVTVGRVAVFLQYLQPGQRWPRHVQALLGSGIRQEGTPIMGRHEATLPLDEFL